MVRVMVVGRVRVGVWVRIIWHQIIWHRNLPAPSFAAPNYMAPNYMAPRFAHRVLCDPILVMLRLTVYKQSETMFSAIAKQTVNS